MSQYLGQTWRKLKSETDLAQKKHIPEGGKKLIVSVGCKDAAKTIRQHGFDVVNVNHVKDLMNPRGTFNQPSIFLLRSTEIRTQKTEDVVSGLRGVWPVTDIVVWAPRCSADLVLGVMKVGAKDVVLSDETVDVIVCLEQVAKGQKITPRIQNSGRSRSHKFIFEGMVSRSPKMWEIFADVEQVAGLDANVLILGETGTGKEMVARAIHRRSGRKGRFVAINCAAVPEHLIDSELFGHVKGAFTGANHDKKGLFRYADGGTILLDEIGNMPLPAQYHLLRVLQESMIRPVGAHEEVKVDARIIAATSLPLEKYMEEGRFREDLFYRLDVFRIVIPPLRDRHDDIAFLFAHFAKKIAKQYGLKFPELTDSFLDALIELEWPGNVRQLQNITERLILAHANQKLARRHLARALKPYEQSQHSGPEGSQVREPVVDTRLPFDQAVEPRVSELEKAYLVAVLKQHDGRIQKAADHAGFSRRTLLRKLNQYNIDKKNLDSQM